MPHVRLQDLESSVVPNSIVISDTDGVPTYYPLTPSYLVAPVIYPSWSVYKTDQVTYWPDLSTSNSHNITVENGCQVVVNGYYKYPTVSGNQILPVSVSGSWGIVLPGAVTASPNLYPGVVYVTSNQSFSVTLAAPATGLIVNGTQVIQATGNNTTQDSISVSFLSAAYFGYSSLSSLTGPQIMSLNNKQLQSSRTRTITNFTSGNNYTYYCYPATFGALNNVIQNGALPVLGAFTQLSNQNMINDAGITINMIVYRSNSLNAFTNVTINFS